jgi:pimeloyl-ACP methyl ester carboxylesterase
VPVADVNGTRLFQRTAGAGPDVVLVHGLGASHAFWYPKVATDLARDHRVTVYDLRGHGRSAMPPSGYHVPIMADDLGDLLDALGIPAAHVVGHSWGGLVALELALRRPERVASVVVADSRLSARAAGAPADTWEGFDEWQAQVTRAGIPLDGGARLDYRLLERIARGASRPAAASTPSSSFAPFGGFGNGRRSKQRWLELLTQTSAASDLAAARSIAPARLRELRPAMLMIYGARSFALPSGRRVAQATPGCRLAVIPRTGHFHPVVAPAEFVAAVRDFVNEAGQWPSPARA